MSKKIIIGVVILLLIALVVAIAALVRSGALQFEFGTEPPSSRSDNEVASSTPIPNAAPSVFEEWEEPPLTAEGRLFPLRQARLSFGAEGTLQRLLVKEGDAVKAGALLAQLDSTEPELKAQAAQDDLAYQKALLAQTEAGSRAEEIAMAQADYDKAVAEYEKLMAGPTEEEIIILKAALSKAAVAVQEAQAAYDEVSWQPGIGALPQSVALQKATIDYEQAKAKYEQALAGPTEAEIDAARSEIDKAKAQLELERSGASEEEVAVAQARIQQAHTALKQAQLDLGKAQLVAPFAGTVVAVQAHEGEMVSAGAPLITLADLSKLQIKTTDLDEWGVARIEVGQEVILTFKALEKQELRGRVIAIAPRGELLASGATAYTVTIEPEQQIPELRWGMTAEVEFVEG